MSKLGKMPIEKNKAEISVQDKIVTVKGSKGVMSVTIQEGVNVKVDENQVFVTVIDEESINARAFWGLARSLINNAVIGVTNGFIKELEMVGVGYRVEKVGNDLKMQIGYSHPVEIKAPQGITFELDGNTFIKIMGIDKQLVGQVAANIRAIRPPEPYKGKGIKYKDEIIKRKQGKTAKS